MAGARRTAARGSLQAAAAPADPEGGQELPDVLAFADLTADILLPPDTDKRLEAASTGAAMEFVKRHAI
jgi:hypothetical protein